MRRNITIEYEFGAILSEYRYDPKKPYCITFDNIDRCFVCHAAFKPRSKVFNVDVRKREWDEREFTKVCYQPFCVRCAKKLPANPLDITELLTSES